VFHKGAAEFGVLSSVMAIGSVVGALLSARREKPRLRFLFAAAAVFGIACTVAALMPSYWGFAAVLAVVGLAAQTMMTTANGAVQLSTPVPVRGRVMAIYMAIFMGGTPIGAPVVGWVANEFGPRWALGVGAASGVAAALVGLLWLVKYHHLRINYSDRRLSVSHDGRDRAAALAAADLAAAALAAADLAAADLAASEVIARKG